MLIRNIPRLLGRALWRPDDVLFLLAVAAILMIAPPLLPSELPRTTWLAILGPVGGLIRALAAANDRRNTRGRPLNGEPAAFCPSDYTAVIGFLIVLFTPAFFVVAYFWILGPRSAREISWETLLVDVHAAYAEASVIGSVQVPLGFAWVGCFTVLSTLAYLSVLNRGLAFHALLTPIVFAALSVAGHKLYGDPLSSAELLCLLAALVCVCVVGIARYRVWARQAGAPANGTRSTSARSLGLALSLVLLSVLNDILTRGVGEATDPAERPFLAAAFRLAYFSVFLLYVAGWACWRGWHPINGRWGPQIGMLRLALAAALLHTGGNLLRAIAVGNNLAEAPVVADIAYIAVLPLVGALYRTDGQSRSAAQRVREAYAYGGHLSMIGYFGLLLVMLAWLSLKVGVCGRSP
jgi:hypothetical protein